MIKKYRTEKLSRVASCLGVVVSFIMGLCNLSTAVAQSREEKVRNDRTKIEAQGFWIYNNLPLALETAKKTGKPIMVVLRCLPCVECVKLDDDLVEQDPVIKPMLEKFVGFRIVATNGLDLSLFQFDTDQSFAVFFLNADKTIYGRFGTRSHRTEWVGDVSVKGMAAAMQGALELHAKFPANAAALAAKHGPEPEIRSPELFPTLKDKYTATLNYSGNVVQSCIHCHQIGDAQRDLVRSSGKPFPESVLFPYPHPSTVGLILDPDQRATVKDIVPESPAAVAGLKAGDMIETLAGQPLLSMADVQWVLHGTDPAGGKIAASILRNGESIPVTITLPSGWRKAGDISWRVSSWGLRRMALGGLLLKPASPEERKVANIADSAMALTVQHVGQYGPHAAAKSAGFQKGDIITAFDGRTDLLREADLFDRAVTVRKTGDQVPVKVWRNDKIVELTLPMQK